MTMRTALDYLPPPPAKRPEIDAKQAPSPKRYKSVRILFALRDKSAHIPFAPGAVSDATDHPRCRASRRQFIPSCTLGQRGWGTPANVEMCVGEVIPVWQSVIHAEQAPRQCRGVDTAGMSIMLGWSSLAKPYPKSIIKCTYPAKK